MNLIEDFDMTTKEIIERNLNDLPEELLKQVYEFIKSISAKKSKKRNVRSYKLSGQFDNENIRQRAYE